MRWEPRKEMETGTVEVEPEVRMDIELAINEEEDEVEEGKEGKVLVRPQRVTWLGQ